MANTLSRSFGQVPSWIVQAIVGILLTSGVAWAAWATTKTMELETKVAVAASTVSGVKDNIVEIKDAQKDMNSKLDRLLERR